MCLLQIQPLILPFIEAGQKLVRSNYFAHDGQRALSLFTLSNCIKLICLFDTTVLSESMDMTLSLQQLSSLVFPFSPSCPLSCRCFYYTSIVHVFCCPRQTQYLRFETSFRPEDHTDWEKAPPSCDLQSQEVLI